MKSIAVLLAGNITDRAFEPFSDGKSAFYRAVSAAAQFPHVSKIVVFVPEKYPGDSLLPAVSALHDMSDSAAGNSVSFDIIETEWSVGPLFLSLKSETEDFDHVYISWADAPFTDPEFTAKLFKKHMQQAAEYTFADGYPYGLSPEILARGIVPILSDMEKESRDPITRNAVFDIIKKDINSFDIETDIAPADLRHLRLQLTCDTKRNTQVCMALSGINAANYADVIQKNTASLYTVPAFYAIQVAGKCPYECDYCPYPQFCKSGKGSSPGVPATERTDYMTADDFSAIAGKIAGYSEDAVVSLSLWGEPSYHPEIAEMVRTVLAYPGLSVLIETTGLGWTEEKVEAIKNAVSGVSAGFRKQNPVNWIVSLDAVSPECYGIVHGIKEKSLSEKYLAEALNFTDLLIKSFPGAVWPQMVRMKENEKELEHFYRFWKEKNGQVIIQKHDSFSRSIEDRRVADLSPLVRNPCWHLKRDMSILIDGAVPLCREDIYAARFSGNVITDGLEQIREKVRPVYDEHTQCVYKGLCEDCDEYYTYNF
ncbi:spiro-SPASM protein [Brucepastera parasyntrophica]|uniref:spiro-SPASM protein n=1 Tax=Brucepastera parasyntrophica TaxID=2880008 RepID=UPI00210E4864|nr:spiro-SPASM protein [Brucepastera parasyntrophica]ULQ60135.1 spiro-SPASM protein [Brucepastera parasyntrophica]